MVEADGNRYIENLIVAPTDDNFDWIGGDDDTNRLNNAIRPFIDPSDVIMNWTWTNSESPVYW